MRGSKKWKKEPDTEFIRSAVSYLMVTMTAP